jgi:hypothetical protein
MVWDKGFGAACDGNDSAVTTSVMTAGRHLDDARDAIPMVLTIEEAARVLRISRSGAYVLARRYLESQGRSGLPVLVFGSNSLRVPRWALLQLLETGEVPRLAQDAARVRRAG